MCVVHKFVDVRLVRVSGVNGPTSPFPRRWPSLFLSVALCITNLCHRDAKKLFMSAKAAAGWRAKSDRRAEQILVEANGRRCCRIKTRTVDATRNIKQHFFFPFPLVHFEIAAPCRVELSSTWIYCSCWEQDERPAANVMICK